MFILVNFDVFIFTNALKAKQQAYELYEDIIKLARQIYHLQKRDTIKCKE